MNKGYIVPAILIVLLLILAGFFVSTPAQNPAKTDTLSPRLATTTPIIKENSIEEIVNTTTTTEVVEESEELEEISTSTNSI